MYAGRKIRAGESSRQRYPAGRTSRFQQPSSCAGSPAEYQSAFGGKERNSLGLSFSSRPGRGLHAGIGEEAQLGQVAACHEDSLGESLVLDRTRNPEPADAEG